MRPRRKDGGLACGKAAFIFARVTTAKLPFEAKTNCVMCGDAMTVRYGEPLATFKVGAEFVGVSCDRCLSPDSRRTLAQLREAQAAGR
jgi:hypothetical protein